MDASIIRVVDVALLRPQPFDERGRPVRMGRTRRVGSRRSGLPRPKFPDLPRGSQSVELEPTEEHEFSNDISVGSIGRSRHGVDPPYCRDLESGRSYIPRALAVTHASQRIAKHERR